MSILFPVPELVDGKCQIETCGNGKETVKVKRERLLRDKSARAARKWRREQTDLRTYCTSFPLREILIKQLRLRPLGYVAMKEDQREPQNHKAKRRRHRSEYVQRINQAKTIPMLCMLNKRKERSGLANEERNGAKKGR